MIHLINYYIQLVVVAAVVVVDNIEYFVAEKSLDDMNLVLTFDKNPQKCCFADYDIDIVGIVVDTVGIADIADIVVVAVVAVVTVVHNQSMLVSMIKNLTKLF